MNFNTESIPIYIGIFTIAGALIGFLSSIITTLISNKYSVRKHLNELIVNAAIEDWKNEFKIAKDSKIPQYISPIDDYIIRMVKLSELLKRKNITEKDIKKKLKELDNLSTLLAEFRSWQINRNKELGINLEKYNK